MAPLFVSQPNGEDITYTVSTDIVRVHCGRHLMEHLFWKHHQFNKVIVDPRCTLSGWTSRMYFMWNRTAIGNVVLKYTRSQFSSATVFLNWVYRYMCKVPSIVWPDILCTLNYIKCDSRFVLHFWRIYIMSPSDPNDLLYLIWMLQHTFHCLNFFIHSGPFY